MRTNTNKLDRLIILAAALLIIFVANSARAASECPHDHIPNGCAEVVLEVSYATTKDDMLLSLQPDYSKLTNEEIAKLHSECLTTTLLLDGFVGDNGYIPKPHIGCLIVKQMIHKRRPGR